MPSTKTAISKASKGTGKENASVVSIDQHYLTFLLWCHLQRLFKNLFFS